MAINGTSANLGSQSEPWVTIVEAQLKALKDENTRLAGIITQLVNKR